MPVIKRNNNVEFFSFRLEDESELWEIPNTVTDGSDTISLNSDWQKTNIMGSTEPMVAFNYVDSPTIPISIKFHADMFREYNLKHTYEATIGKLLSLVYPDDRNTSYIKPPFLRVQYGNSIYRGYFTNIRVTTSGPIRNGLKVICQFSATLNVVKKQAPKMSDILNNFRNAYM